MMAEIGVHKWYLHARSSEKSLQRIRSDTVFLHGQCTDIVQRDQGCISVIYADHCHRSIADIESGKHIDVDTGVICHDSLDRILVTNNDYSALRVVAANVFHPADEASLHLKDIFSARNLGAAEKHIERLPPGIQ
jgi:hypothetical protein